MPVIPVLGRVRLEDHEFEASLDYIVRPSSLIMYEKILKNQKYFIGDECVALS
jgi:hypothetical protein